MKDLASDVHLTPPPRRKALGYALAVVASVVSLALRLFVDPMLGDRSPFLTLTLGYALAAWVGGTGPGILATVLTTAGSAALFVDPRWSFDLSDPAEQVRVGGTLLFGVFGSWVIGSRSEALDSERWIAAQLRQREAEVRRTSEELLARTRDLEGFTHAVSHELRTPLRHMRAFAEALHEDCEQTADPVALGHAACIVTASARMEHLIADLMAFSHVAQGPVQLGPTPLGPAVEAALAPLAAELDRRGAHVDVDLACDVVTAHEGTLVRALTNLLDNAIKYVPTDRAPVLRIESRAQGARCRISVEDNGVGIEADDLARVFGIFVRLHAQDDVPGHGIGLALVTRAAERMDGTVGVTSRPGEGSRFWIDLPRAPSTEDHDRGRAHHPAGRGQPLRRAAAAAQRT